MNHPSLTPRLGFSEVTENEKLHHGACSYSLAKKIKLLTGLGYLSTISDLPDGKNIQLCHIQ
ncbi:MAG TPA: hypothetical protein VE954_02140 [Oligoflexus sp.]|uniref:hypothetical protein n=1 Tax=Oligoflexus sp. TaxID=1971216 RepID=UPI002D7269D4|nr:hypothetical protein [Oligoflexus sp.]HYX31886.1 hypothetical protein [Oligoflexus sp.]